LSAAIVDVDAAIPVVRITTTTTTAATFADRYVSFARDHADIFISINHEVNSITVYDVIRSVMPDAVSMRYSHPMRPAYVEEVVFTGRSKIALSMS
jgi:hypothetical protein